MTEEVLERFRMTEKDTDHTVGVEMQEISTGRSKN